MDTSAITEPHDDSTTEPLATAQGKEAAIAALAKRRLSPPVPVNNAKLSAGSPIYFYCTSCKHLVCKLSENYVEPPNSLCNECQALKDCGWLD